MSLTDSQYTTPNKLADLSTVINNINSYIAKSSRDDRTVMFTAWIDMLINSGQASSVTQACKQISSLPNFDVTHQAIARYYKGDKTNV